MPRIHIFPSFMLAAVVLAGCSSDSSTATPGGDTAVQLNFGTTSETDSSNGQPFADEVSQNGEAPPPGAGFDDAGQVLLVTRSIDGTTDEVVINLANANYSIDRGDLDVGRDGAFLLEINGEDIPFTFGDSSSGLLLVGESEDGTEYEIRTASNGVFSSTNLISIVNGTDPGAFGLYTFGFETRPGDLPADGSVDYAGDLAGGVYSDGETSDLTGEIQFTANFGTSRISGTANATAFSRNIEFSINETDIVGNGFTTTATAVCPILDACESNTQIGGAFFGPDGSEISGIAVIDETITTDLGTSNVVGAAGYTADRTTP